MSLNMRKNSDKGRQFHSTFSNSGIFGPLPVVLLLDYNIGMLMINSTGQQFTQCYYVNDSAF